MSIEANSRSSLNPESLFFVQNNQQSDLLLKITAVAVIVIVASGSCLAAAGACSAAAIGDFEGAMLLGSIAAAGIVICTGIYSALVIDDLQNSKSERVFEARRRHIEIPLRPGIPPVDRFIYVPEERWQPTPFFKRNQLDGGIHVPVGRRQPTPFVKDDRLDGGTHAPVGRRQPMPPVRKDKLDDDIHAPVGK
ncbi:MAG: hypothetical protein V4489_02205 [Chlamydiota bacterium]